MKFEVPIHELGAGDVSACENLGVTLSRLFGLSSDICWLAVNHVLGAISASGCTFRSTLLPGRFHAGGLILVGEVRRVRLLIDWLLAPIERIQSQSLAAHQTADPAVLNRYMQEDSNPVVRGITKSFLDEPRDAHQGFRDRTRLARALDSVKRPLLVMRNPNRNTVMNNLSMTFDRSPLIVEDELQCNDSVNEKTYFKWLATSLGCSADWEGNTGARNVPRYMDSCPALLATLTHEGFAVAVAQPRSAIYGLFHHSVTIPAEISTTQSAPDSTPLQEGEAESATNIWWKIIEEAIAFRSLHSHNRWDLCREENQYLAYYRNEILKIVDSTSSPCRNLRTTLPDLPARNMWSFQFLRRSFKCTPPKISEESVRLTGMARRQQDRIFAEIEKARIDSEIERSKKSILRALIRSGGHGEWPDIRRSLRRQSFKDNEPAITALLSEGSLEQGPDGVYRLPNATKKEEHEH